MYVKMGLMLFKIWKCEFKLTHQTGPEFFIELKFTVVKLHVIFAMLEPKKKSNWNLILVKSSSS